MCNCNKRTSSTPTVISSVRPKANAVSAKSVQVPIVKSNARNATRRIYPPAQTLSANTEASSQNIVQNLEGETFADKCLTFGYVLGLDKAVPEKVLYAALEDSGYAKRLLMGRNKPSLYDLLNNPPAFSGNSHSENNTFSNGQLIAKAGKALLNWGLAGFPTVSKATLQKREDACLQCPNLQSPPNFLQKISASSSVTDQIGNRTGNKSCSICGCVLKNKMRLATDTCPNEVAATPGFNRWGENFIK